MPQVSIPTALPAPHDNNNAAELSSLFCRCSRVSSGDDLRAEDCPQSQIADQQTVQGMISCTVNLTSSPESSSSTVVTVSSKPHERAHSSNAAAHSSNLFQRIKHWRWAPSSQCAFPAPSTFCRLVLLSLFFPLLKKEKSKKI